MSIHEAPKVGEANLFPSASNVSVHGGTMLAIGRVELIAPSAPRDNDFEYLRLLEAEVSPNAILNAGGRADPVSCYPGTREEVINKAQDWMVSGYRDDRRIFWLSGPAGAGKSAIVQTIAENCVQHQVPMANFFFFRSDSTRNSSHPVVPTLLYQLFPFYPDLKAMVNDLIGRDRLIFKKSIRDQFITLVDKPIRAVRSGLLTQAPIYLLIDGLDECDRLEAGLAAKAEQIALLDIIHEFGTASDSQFITLVASRVESHIEMAFNRIGRAHSSIYLDEQYRPDADIRLYITAELSRIKCTHPLGKRLEVDWPSQSIIDEIVQKSSGQFIYAATVSRFIADSPQSPAFTMEMVLGVRPPRKSSPFAEIDSIYSFILSRSNYWDAVCDILAMNAIIQNFHEREVNSIPNTGKHGSSVPLAALGYTTHEAESFFSDLTPLIRATVSSGKITLHFYHASFPDFIYSTKRAGRFYVDLPGFADMITPTLFAGISDSATLIAAVLVLEYTSKISNSLTSALTDSPGFQCPMFNKLLKKKLLDKVNQLYAKHPSHRRAICDTWSNWFDPLFEKTSYSRPQPRIPKTTHWSWEGVKQRWRPFLFNKSRHIVRDR